MNAAEGCLDGLLGVSEVGMANDICQRFIDSQNDGAAFGLGESQFRRELSQGISHHAEHLGIAPQFHFE